MLKSAMPINAIDALSLRVAVTFISYWSFASMVEHEIDVVTSIWRIHKTMQSHIIQELPSDE